MAAWPYVHDAKHTSRVLDLVLNGTTPGTVSPAHLAANGFPGAGAAQAVDFLQSLGLLDGDGSPTARWAAYRDADDPSSVLAAIVREAYAPLIELTEAGSPSDAELQALVEPLDPSAPDQPAQVVSTFRTLCVRAGITTDAPAPTTSSSARPRRDVLRDVSDLLQRSVTEFEQARQCLEHDLTRPAHVAAWSSYVALAFAQVSADDFDTLRTTARRVTLPLEDLLREVHSGELIRLLVKQGLVSADETDALHALLAQRNECIHPVPYAPDRETTAAYLSAVLTASAQLTERVAATTATTVTASAAPSTPPPPTTPH